MARATIAIVGAGRMGRGIALAFAYAGLAAYLIDIKPRSEADFEALAEAARGEIRADLATLARFGALDADAARLIEARIQIVPGAAAALSILAQAEVVFEAVPEVLALKREALAWIGARVPRATVVASTTSSFVVTELAAMIEAPERFLNAHWLNPAHLIPLVELSVHPRTAEAVRERLGELLQSIGKVPVVCAAAPGYIVPRLQALLMNEAARMIEQGVASAAEIDKATRYGLGLRFAALGVVEFIDFGGNDTLFYASRYLAETLGDTRYAAPDCVVRMMQAGQTGLKSGQGFFDYRDMDRDAYRHDALERVYRMIEHKGLARPPVLDQ